MLQLCWRRMLINNPDKLGFYYTPTQKSYNKLDIISSVDTYVSYNFNDEVYTKVNWLVPPNISLWELYKTRARQIREKYDYCVIFYSGGSDSQNILDAWLDAGCKVDEVATFHYFKGSGNKYSFMNAEVTHVAFPRIKKLQETHKFKFREIDISDDVVDIFSNNEFVDDYATWASQYLSPNNYAKINWRTKNNDYTKMITAGKTVCFIWGADKPSVFVDETGKWYFQFMDIFSDSINPWTQRNAINLGLYDELFYWTPDLPEMIVKQAHAIKQFCTTNNNRQHYTTEKTRFGYNRALNMFLTPHAVKNIIYPTWDPATFCDGKTLSSVWSLRDQWFIHSGLQSANKFKSASLSLINAVPAHYRRDITNPLEGIIPSVSNRYYLE